jgi:hypothetical protein
MCRISFILPKQNKKKLFLIICNSQYGNIHQVSCRGGAAVAAVGAFFAVAAVVAAAVTAFFLSVAPVGEGRGCLFTAVTAFLLSVAPVGEGRGR